MYKIVNNKAYVDINDKISYSLHTMCRYDLFVY